MSQDFQWAGGSASTYFMKTALVTFDFHGRLTERLGRHLFLIPAVQFISTKGLLRLCMEHKYPWMLNISKLTWLALDEDHAARSRKVEQLIAL